MPEIVALDLETTGLDPKNDSIIEIGAVKFNENRVIAEYSTLVNPRKPINAFITNLTGISNSMVMNAPCIGDVCLRSRNSSATPSSWVKTSTLT